MKLRSLRGSMYSIFLISILVPLFLIAAFFPFYYGQLYRQNNERNISNTLASIATNIEIYIKDLESISQTPYQYSTVLNHMRNINIQNDNPNDNLLLANQQEDEYTMIFAKQMHNSSHNISKISYYPANNPENEVFLITKNRANLQIEADANYKGTEWYEQAVEKNGEYIFIPDENSHEDSDCQFHSFLFVRTIKDFDNNKNIGTLKIDSTSETIDEILNQVALTEGCAILLTDAENNLLCANLNSADLLQNIPLVSILNGDSPTHYPLYHDLEKSGLQLIYLQASSEFLRYTILIYSITILVAALACMIAFVLYRFQSKKMMVSINNILYTFQEIEKGNLNVKVDIKSNMELAEISKGLNHMAKKLDRHIEQEYKAVISQREAEFMALQSQINPHFLYNTLNGFVALNRMGEKQLLEKSIIELTRLFQYACSNEKTTTIEKEAEFIQQYLALQSLKYDDRLNYSIHIDDRTKELLIPKLLLQPLVENSILHGMEPTNLPIMIHVITELITLKPFGEYLAVLVMDNGIGFDPNHKTQKSERIGLTNIQNRLKYFNADSLFFISSTPSEGTKVTILIHL